MIGQAVEKRWILQVDLTAIQFIEHVLWQDREQLTDRLFRLGLGPRLSRRRTAAGLAVRLRWHGGRVGVGRPRLCGHGHAGVHGESPRAEQYLAYYCPRPRLSMQNSLETMPLDRIG